MPSFRDSEGVEWKVRIDLGVLRDLEEATGKPIFDTIANPERLRLEIIGSVPVVAKGLYFACLAQAQERRISYVEFERRIAGPSIGAAALAFFTALMECFPLPEDKTKARPTASRGPGKESTALRLLLRRLFRGPIRSGS